MLVSIISRTGYAGLQMGEASRTHTERISLVVGATERSGAKRSVCGEGVLFSMRKNENFQWSGDCYTPSLGHATRDHESRKMHLIDSSKDLWFVTFDFVKAEVVEPSGFESLNWAYIFPRQLQQRDEILNKGVSHLVNNAALGGCYYYKFLDQLHIYWTAG